MTKVSRNDMRNEERDARISMPRNILQSFSQQTYNLSQKPNAQHNTQSAPIRNPAYPKFGNWLQFANSSGGAKRD